MENLYVFIHYNFVIYLVQSNGIWNYKGIEIVLYNENYATVKHYKSCIV